MEHRILHRPGVAAVDLLLSGMPYELAIAACITIITVFSYQMIKNNTISLDRVIGLSKLDTEDMVDLALIKLDEILDLPLDLDLEKEL